jgi:sugar phosphate isomerase/epimerase
MSTLINRISVRDHMITQAAGTIPFFDALAQAGLSAFELQIDLDLTTPHVRQGDGTAYSLATDAGVAAFQQTLATHRVHLSAVLLMTDFSAANSAEQVQWAIAAVRLAGKLGVPAVRVDPLTRNKELQQTTVRDNFVAAIRQVLRQTADTGVDLGIENHGPFGNAPEFLDAIFDAVADPRLGMTLDTGNFYWWGVPLEELYALLARYAPRAKHTHMKNINYPPDLAKARRPIGLDYGKYCCSLDEGNIDLRRVIGILTQNGYRRDFCIENESLGKVPAEMRLGLLKRDVQALAEAIA